jgi:DNA (cytosine-5)-methyltransferase 1
MLINAEELVIDNFAGGGGTSTGIEAAIGRPADIAINHDPEAIAMHAANHPRTRHLCENVWNVDIAAVTNGRPVALCWFSPDCKHFSKAKGGKPVEKRIRGLAWVALKWAGIAKPRVIILENVEEFQDWGPVVDGQPCPRRKGMTFKRWVTQLRNLGYVVDWRELRACDYGAPTIRKRLFVIARRDGMTITWPDETHAPEGDLFLQAYRTAADCIDWSLPCASIFLTKEEGRKIGVNRPLAEATMRRIARGVKRYVIDAAEPFIINLTHQGNDRNESLNEPFRTVTGARRGEKALVVPHITRFNQNGIGHGMDEPLDTAMAGAPRFGLCATFLSSYYGAKCPAGDARGSSLANPIATQPTENRHALVAAFLAKHFTGVVGSDINHPISTVTSVDHNALVSSHLLKLRGTCRDGQPTDEPMATVSAQGTHLGEIRAFLMKYYGTGESSRLVDPMPTVTSKDRMALVTVHGEPYVIADIGMRMLAPRELFRAQGFPEKYIIDRGRSVESGRWIGLTKTAQVRMCGNSVSPPVAEALVRAQFSELSKSAAA